MDLFKANTPSSWANMYNYIGNPPGAESKYRNCGIIVTGGFNHLDVTRLLNHFWLKQVVKVPTRKGGALDLILTNMHKYYNPPQGYPGFGLSDHNTILATEKNVLPNVNIKN